MATDRKTIERDEILRAMAGDVVVLTGNARLSRALLADYERWMLDEGNDAWPTPCSLPWSAWLLKAWENASLHSAAPLPRLLTPEQEHQVWASIIRADHAGLLRVEATAQRLRASWKRVQEWQLDLNDYRFKGAENAEVFKRWAFEFRTLCARNSYVSESEVPGLLVSLLAGNRYKLPGRIILTGFYEMTPAQAELMEVMGQAGCEISWAEIRGKKGVSSRFCANDAHHEMQSSVLWARKILLESPGARIGIVVPDLSSRHSQLGHLLAKTLDPVSFQPGSMSAARSWNISLGRNLGEYPIIKTALQLLTLMINPVRTEILGALLLSPHWGLPRNSERQTAELSRRALLDNKIRGIGDTGISLSSIHYYASQRDEEGKRKPWSSDRLAARLARIIKQSRDLPGRAASGEWARHFATWLSSSGWAAGRALDSNEYQAVEAWHKLLSDFSSLGDFADPMPRSDALALLGRLAGEAIFQPGTGAAPVQVLGLYEANGLTFDYLWVMDLHDGAWPPAPHPDAFIPLTLQRERLMPHCDPDQELEMAASMTAQLQSAAPEVVFSYPGKDGNEVLACSPLIVHLPPAGIDDIPQSHESGWQHWIRTSASLEAVPRGAAITLRDAESYGGSRIFKNQADCPFRAFAEHRLGAKPLERPQLGLGPMRRGTLLHKALELLWRELKTQANLLGLTNEALGAMVRATIGQAIEMQRKRSFHTMTGRFSDIEAERLEGQVVEWLELERQRSPFTVVGFEEEKIVDISGVRLRVFIDRIDELEDGRKVIVDYKTGTISSSGWFGERPDDPQLPVYSVACGDATIAAVAFGQLRFDSVRFNGVVSEPGILPGLPVNRKGPQKEATDTWPQVLTEWSDVLHRLASGFSSGAAQLDPKNGLKTCENSYCELAPLCRIHEQGGRVDQ